jgi:pimeloyl-ACP methyl ester carboxylesterase
LSFRADIVAAVREDSIDRWWRDGTHVALDVDGSARRVFVRRLGAGPHMTLLHGFPSSSHDWAKVVPGLAERHTVLLCDFLGFGASDKPQDHTYSIHEQADLVTALWRHDDVDSTILVAHDYGVSVAQELLARRAQSVLMTDLDAVNFLNGGLYPDLHRPEPIQTALLDPVQGPQISAIATEEVIVAALAPTFAADYDAAADSVAIARSLARADGLRNLHLLIRYLLDRREHAARWTGALETTDVPLSFVWGMLDPVSGAQMAERVRERLPEAPLVALDDVGHWPPLEAPERVLAALLTS